MKRNELLSIALASAAASFASTSGIASAAPAPVERIARSSSAPLTVGVVVGSGATVIDFAGPWEVFQDVSIPDGTSTKAAFQLAMISDRDDVLNATGGMIVKPRFTYATAPAFPNILVMGAQGEHTPAKIAWIREAASHADVVMSVCTGAFLLAKTGLLDGLDATTHHDFYDDFQRDFPKVRLIRGPRFVDNGKIATAGGLTSGIELALHVVQRYFGDAVTLQTAGYMEYNRSSTRPPAEKLAG